MSEGLEGRCESPVALLFDALLRPDTDIGANMESVLTWKREKQRAVPHLVLGRNLPGGAWHVSGGPGVGPRPPCSSPHPTPAHPHPPSPTSGPAPSRFAPCGPRGGGLGLESSRPMTPFCVQSIEGSMVTLSQGQWMGLPDLQVKDWMQKKRR